MLRTIDMELIALDLELALFFLYMQLFALVLSQRDRGLDMHRI